MLIVYIGFLFVIYRITPPFFHPEIVVERNAGNMKFYSTGKPFRPRQTRIYWVPCVERTGTGHHIRISPKYLNTNDELL
jgi:hypothetical protein